ncbi:MAG: putative lipid II flippase FtsW [Acidimicrobiales bacterium]|nr:putative lipid II flippase FtsW [Acidimicrobiales bacterium]
MTVLDRDGTDLVIRRRVRRLSATKPGGKRSGSFLALFSMLVLLNIVGLVMILSASTVTSLENYGSPWYQFTRHLMWLAVGTTCFVISLRIDFHCWRDWTKYLLRGSLLLLILVLVPGVGRTVNGASRWIGYGPVTVQPSEIAKLALLLYVADLLARRSHRIGDTQLSLRPVLVVFFAIAALVMLQPNLGTTIILFMIVFVMLFVAGVPGKHLALLAGTGAIGGALFAFTEDYRRRRLTAFADPWADPLNTGYQTIQSSAALANGGLVGTGIGQGRAKYGFLPEAHTDFIFSVLGEELGFIGALVLLAIFVAFGAFAIRVALRAPDRFGMLVAVGITTWFMFQALVNIGAAVGVLPTTGVPLPFVSFGGSSLVVNFFAAGILLNIARHTS